MKFLIKLFISAVAIYILGHLLPGVTLDPPYTTALIVAVVLALLNILVKPILVILTIPITILTLGIFLLVINAVIILLADKLVSGFAVSSMWTALWFSILLSFLQWVLQAVIKEEKK